MKSTTSIQTRIFSVDDPYYLAQVKEIFLQHDQLKRGSYVSGEDEFHQRIKRLKDKNSIFCGYFINDVLTTLITVTEWSHLPFYTINNLYVRKGFTRFFDLKKSGLGEILDTVVAHEEKKERYTFYFSRMRKKKWQQGMTRRTVNEFSPQYLSRYEFFIEEVVPAFTRSSFVIHDTLLANKEWPDESIIVRRSLKEEYRNELTNK